jgi:NADH-quinone oxidoreductase subunit C
VVYDPVSLPQDYRTFDFLSPWEGMLAKEEGKPSAPPRQTALDRPSLQQRPKP